MAKNIENGVSNFPQRMFTPDFFLCLGKEKGEDFQTSCRGFKNKWPEVEPPSRYGLWKMVDKFHTFKTLQNRWPIASEWMKSVWSEENIASVPDPMWTLSKECYWIHFQYL